MQRNIDLKQEIRDRGRTGPRRACRRRRPQACRPRHAAEQQRGAQIDLLSAQLDNLKANRSMVTLTGEDEQTERAKQLIQAAGLNVEVEARVKQVEG